MNVFGDQVPDHTRRICTFCASSLVGTSKGGVREKGKVLELLKKTEGFGHVASTSRQKHEQQKSANLNPLIVSAPNSTRRAVYANRRSNIGITAIPNSRTTWGTSQCPTASSIPLWSRPVCMNWRRSQPHCSTVRRLTGSWNRPV